jgi:hypothetical protein
VVVLAASDAVGEIAEHRSRQGADQQAAEE